MESSRIGRPNMESVLDDSFKPAGDSRSWSSCDCEGLMAECDEGNQNNTNNAMAQKGNARDSEELGEYSCDSPLTLVRAAAAAEDNASPKLVRPNSGGELSLSRSHGKANSEDEDDDDDRDFNTTTTMSDNCNLFVPELMYQLDANDDGKPPMPDLPISAFPRGTSVWVTDISHVMLQMGDAWDHGTRDVCNGQAKGVVVRIVTEDLLFVRFEDETNEMVHCHTLPRRCLSTSRIEPYPLPDDLRAAGALGGSFGCIGGLKPRAGRGPANAGKDRRQRDAGGSDDKEGSRERDDRENCVLQQYCEVVDAGTPSRRTEAAWNMFLKKRFKDCIAELNEIYEKARADGMDSLTLNEILTWRSFAYFFNKDYDKSLADALQTIENSTSWVRGYVRAARAYTGLGQINRAIEMMTHAGKLLPKSSEVADTLRMLGYLKKIQAKVDVYGLRYYLDPSYAKRLQATNAFQRGEVILEDDAIIVGCPSIENEGTFCCELCLIPTQNLVQVGSHASSSSLSSLSSASLAGSPPPTNKDIADGQQFSSGSKSVRLCGPRCEAIGRNFLIIETGTGGKACTFAEQLLLNKAANSADVLAIDRARLAMRLFYLAHYRHSRMHKHRHDLFNKQSQSGDISGTMMEHSAPRPHDPPDSPGRHLSPNSAPFAASLRSAHPTVREVLAAIGVFPIPSLELDAKTRDNVEALYTVVSSFMTPEEKQVYDRDLFVLAYNYAVNYAIRISGGVDDRGRPISGLVIANTASCLERCEPTGTASASNSMTVNCEVRLVGPSRVAVVATCDINVGDRLVMHAPKKGRY